VELAELGAFASETALDGRAGLFAAMNRSERASAAVPFSTGPLEIMSVYHKPAPACNYAQTACQAALALAVEDRVQSRNIVGIQIKCSAAAVAYPGCSSAGPFDRILQAKMSIPYCVAATLATGRIEEANYRLLRDREVKRLVTAATLEADSRISAEYPRLQGAEVVVTLRDGQTRRRSLRDVVPATPGQIRASFRSASDKVLGPKATSAIEGIIGELERQKDAGMLGAHLSLPQSVWIPK
jgi:2-methylcitrate dehydratase PrpD